MSDTLDCINELHNTFALVMRSKSVLGLEIQRSKRLVHESKLVLAGKTRSASTPNLRAHGRLRDIEPNIKSHLKTMGAK